MAIHYKYDVFLSFRGEDTGYSFAAHLHEALRQAGISAFKDDDEIQELKPEIEKSILKSRASIIVLSRNYVNSSRCLDELLLILKQRTKGGCFVLPVFYNVNTSDIRNHQGSFMMEAKEGVVGSKWTEDNMIKWKAALTEVSDIKGMTVSGNETVIIADIVHEIYHLLDLKPRSFLPASVVKEFEHLKIHLEEVKKATNSFGCKVIGAGGFGKVYEGEVSHSKGRSMVAIKRLNREFGQGDPEFWKEIMMLSSYTHKNLISLLGFCDEDGEKILVYEHASNGSLDHHLSSTDLKWTQRLKICLDAAKGLSYLHDHKGTQQRVLHRDIKSANILLDDNWNAKLSDMGLSKIGPANQRHTFLFTNVVGTPGYCDPQYMETYTLTKESDIYSLGVVLFEVLCGRLCFKWTNNHLEILVPMWKQSCIHKKLDQILFKDLTPPMDPSSLETFSDIAFQCLHYSREQRPAMSLLVKRLETALEFQRLLEMKLPTAVGTPQEYKHVDELSDSVLHLKSGKRKWVGDEQKETEGRDGSAAIARKGAAQPHVNTSGVAGGKLVHFDVSMGFTADDLLNATEMTGKNTYGHHYKTTLENGGEVAIKRLREDVTKNHRQIEVELNLLGKIKHPNILAMRACYLGPEGDKLLVFNYMPKGSLADFLHARGPKTQLDWAIRMQIAKGVTRGLLSLHAHHNIIHGNLTSHNVLLDENINPKISDFELLRVVTDAAHSNMIAEARILGYQAPEVSNLKEVDMKADVYSLGVIILELLTGKAPAISSLCLPQLVALIVKKGGTSKVFDPELMKDASAVGDNALLNTLKLALKCIHPSPQNRPDAQLVLQRLDEIGPETSTN